MATDFNTLSTADLTATFNATFKKNVKIGSYTRGKMIAALEAQAQTEETAQIEFEAGSNEETPYPAPALEAEETEAEKIERLLDEGACPLCGGDPSNQTAAGAEGTFLGDSCQFCHECGKTYSCLDGQEVDVPAEKGASKKRRILNPQVKINAKTEACAVEGIEVFYSKPTRLWVISDNLSGKVLTSMDSRQFAQYTPAELVAYTKCFRK